MLAAGGFCGRVGSFRVAMMQKQHKKKKQSVFDLENKL
jgi:hypothetical protein